MVWEEIHPNSKKRSHQFTNYEGQRNKRKMIMRDIGKWYLILRPRLSKIVPISNWKAKSGQNSHYHLRALGPRMLPCCLRLWSTSGSILLRQIKHTNKHIWSNNYGWDDDITIWLIFQICLEWNVCLPLISSSWCSGNTYLWENTNEKYLITGFVIILVLFSPKMWRNVNLIFNCSCNFKQCLLRGLCALGSGF